MRTLTTMVIALLMVANFTPELQAQKKGEKTLVIEANMTGGECELKIEEDIASERGVKTIDANYESGLVTITYREKRNNDEGFVKALEELGYKAKIAKDKKECDEKKESKTLTRMEACCGKKG
ncbi:MAG: heavy-metal-associated domain-containing protein [Bacteroidales bacterium]